ncbi:MAG: L,D-transpeptidase family protein [bacterium]|nr:L,D-transpeptidase family protein [bacterium]
MEDYSNRHRGGGARTRHEARKARRQPMVRPLDANTERPPRSMVNPAPAAETQPVNSPATRRNPRVEMAETLPPPRSSPAAQNAARAALHAARAVENVDWRGMRRGSERAVLVARDGVWYARNNPRLLFSVIGALVLVFALWTLFHIGGSRLFPGVSTMGLSMGSLTTEEAIAALQTYWNRDLRITLRDQERTWEVTPAEFGLRLNARATVEDMREVGMAGIPFGFNVLPTVEMDVLTTQNKLLDLSEQAQIQPYNAGYRWEGDILVGVEGTDGRFLDVSGTLNALQEDLPFIVSARTMDMLMTTIPPEVVDPEPFMDDVRALVANTFVLNGYDPFTNDTWAWATDRTTFINWLEAGTESLTLREEAFAPFVAQQTEVLQRDSPLRYLEPTETITAVRDAIRTRQSTVNLRVRYQPTTYEVQPGDSGYRIAERTGVPFFAVLDANFGNDLSELYPGQVINLPSRDMTLPAPILANKRIVVDIDTQSMVAFEGNNVVFAWLISTGMSYAPTSPGVYQILSHVDLATGSSYELCTADTCGTWDMYWFMGIYEVVPGLVNGFHGAVVLPNGSYLGGGNVGRPFTYGCVMSENGNAELLYYWAEEGTLVEIISSTYPPQSDLARRVRDGTWRDLPRITPGSTTPTAVDDVASSIQL